MQDKITPKIRWEFDESVTEVFDDMLQRSIPQYDVMRKAVFEVAGKFILRNQNLTVVDLGCSRGGAIADFVDCFPDQRFLGIEVSPPMRQASINRFRDNPNVKIEAIDLRYQYPSDPACVVLSVLTLQFIPIEYRQRIIRSIYESLPKGGAFVLVEKVLGANASINDDMVDVYYSLKARNGYSEEQIQRKRLSLEGVLVPVTADWNVSLLKSAGFNSVDCFWRWMNFAGWIAIK